MVAYPVSSNDIGWGAADATYSAWAFDSILQSNAGTTRLITAGTLNLIGLMVRAPVTVASVDLFVVGAGGTLTSGQNLIGLYDSTGALRGSSADQTTPWGSTGFKGAAALTAQSAGSLTLASGLYWLALLGNGTTMPSFSAANQSANVDSRILNGEASAATARYATNGSGLTALPASFTPSSNTRQQIAAWWAGLA
jgi:hypothetical protein